MNSALKIISRTILGVVLGLVTITILGVGAAVAFVTLYLPSPSGQARLLAAFDGVLGSAGYTASIEGLKGTVPFNFSVEKLVINQQPAPHPTSTTTPDAGVLKVTLTDTHFAWDWRHLLRGKIAIEELRAGSIETVISPEQDPASPPIPGTQTDSKNLGLAKGSRPWMVPLSLEMDRIKVGRVSVTKPQGSDILTLQNIDGGLQASFPGNVTSTLTLGVTKPYPLDLAMDLAANLVSPLDVKAKVTLINNPYANGTLTGHLTQDSRSLMHLTGNFTLQPNEETLGIIALLAPPLAIDYTLGYLKPDTIAWTVKDKENSLLSLAAEGVYHTKAQKGQPAGYWEATYDLALKGLQHLVSGRYKQASAPKLAAGDLTSSGSLRGSSQSLQGSVTANLESLNIPTLTALLSGLPASLRPLEDSGARGSNPTTMAAHGTGGTLRKISLSGTFSAPASLETLQLSGRLHIGNPQGTYTVAGKVTGLGNPGDEGPSVTLDHTLTLGDPLAFALATGLAHPSLGFHPRHLALSASTVGRIPSFSTHPAKGSDDLTVSTKATVEVNEQPISLTMQGVFSDTQYALPKVRIDGGFFLSRDQPPYPSHVNPLMA